MEASINEAAEIKAKAEAKHQEYTARLATLDAELAKLKSDLENAAAADSKRITAEAQEAAARAKVETQSLIEQHAQALANEVRREVVEAAVLAAQQVIAGSVNSDDQQKLADGFRQRIETLATKAGRPSRAPMGGQS
jgi:F0F1-type ATP synthase membrane subunit b/b'